MSRIERALEKASRTRVDKEGADKGIVSGERLVAPEDSLQGKSFDGFYDVTEPLNVDNQMLAALREKNDVVAEEYKKLRTLIVKMTKGESFNNALMITSTVSGEGKTITALNLSISLAKEYDYTVLLVDTDLRRPSVHKYLGLEPKKGLIQCVKEGLPVEEAIIKTGIGRLAVLPAGGTLDDPVEFLSSNQLQQFVSKLKNRYSDRYVIFDTPPMLPFADAQALKNAVDATLFVVRERCAKRQHVKKMLAELKDANLLGVVYNDIETYSANNPYYYY